MSRFKPVTLWSYPITNPMKFLSRVVIPLLAIGASHAQVSSSAYRVLGQTDLHQNGLNLVQGSELNQPSGIALDPRGGQTHVYISDTRNSRVLAWADVGFLSDRRYSHSGAWPTRAAIQQCSGHRHERLQFPSWHRGQSAERRFVCCRFRQQPGLEIPGAFRES